MAFSCRDQAIRFILIILINLAVSVAYADSNQTSNETISLFGNSNSSLIIVNPGESIQDAIEESEPGSIIEIHGGVYRENINISKRFTILGIDDGDGSPIIDAQKNGSAITVSADGVRLESLNINGSGFSDAGVNVVSNNCIIADNRLAECFINLSFSHNNTIRNNILGGMQGESDIRLINSKNNLIQNNILQGVIRLYQSDENNITTNEIYASENYSGIKLTYSKNNSISYNDITGVISSSFSNNNSIKGNKISGYESAINLNYSKNNLLEDNYVEETHIGINLNSSGYNLFNNNSFIEVKNPLRMDGRNISDFDNDIAITNLADGKPLFYIKGARDGIIDRPADAMLIGCFNCTNITLQDQNDSNGIANFLVVNTHNSKFINGSLSIQFYFSNNNTVSQNKISEDRAGVILYSSNNNHLESNEVQDCDFGFSLESSNANDFINNSLVDNQNGVYLASSDNNSFLENHIIGGFGIKLNYSKNNLIAYNYINDSHIGINLNSSAYNLFNNNSFIGVKNPFRMDGRNISDFDNDIAITNLADDKPLFYIKGVSDGIMDRPADAMLIGCFNCTNITLQDQNKSNGIANFLVVNTHNSKFINGSLSIQFYFSNNNTVSQNKISEDRAGVILYSSNNNRLENNNVQDCDFGFSLESSNANDFINNSLVDNQNGFYLASSDNNSLLRNNILGRLYNPYSIIGININSSNNNLLESNMVQNFVFGFYLDSSNDNNIINNSLQDNVVGICLALSDNNFIFRNYIYGTLAQYRTYLAQYGISLLSSNNNYVKNNTINDDINHPVEFDSFNNNEFANNSKIENENKQLGSVNFSELYVLKSFYTEIIVPGGDKSMEEALIAEGTIPDIPEEPASTPNSLPSDSSSDNGGKKRNKHKPAQFASDQPESSNGEGSEEKSAQEAEDLSEPDSTNGISQEEMLEDAAGRVVFNPPSIMFQDVSVVMEAKIAASNTSRLLQDLEGPGMPQIINADIVVNTTYVVTLIGDHFKIEDQRSKEQILTNDPRKPLPYWRWSVTPLERGTHNLTLNVDAVGPNGVTLTSVKKWKVQVEVIEPSFWQKLDNFIAAEWKWILGPGIAIIYGLYRWIRDMKKSAN